MTNRLAAVARCQGQSVDPFILLDTVGSVTYSNVQLGKAAAK